MPRLEPSQVILRLSRVSRQRATSSVLAWVARIGLCVGALLAVFSSPPQMDLQPALPPALALCLVGALALLLPPVLPRVARWRWLSLAIQIAGFFLLSSVIGWAVLSQPIALNMPLALAESLRALPVVALAGLAALLLARLAWQRRALVALVLPTLLALSFIAVRTPPYVLDFHPYWLAVDGHGTLYVTDVESPVIRVFTPDGSLQAKLRPRLAARKGPPGIGFSPPGPWNDPDQLGVPSLTGGQSSAGWLRPWPANTDEFLFCGLAVDSQNRLYVLDWLGNQVLRFTPDGMLDEMWPLPSDYQPSTGCLALNQNRLYVGDQRGRVLTYDLAGHLLGTQTLPGQLTGLSIDPGGRYLYALLANQVWRETLASGQTMRWNLPPPRGALGFPYETLLALPNDQLFVSDLNSNHILRFTGEGRLLGMLGGFGNNPGQFASVGAMALGSDGHLYVTDSDHRVVQRFAPDGRVDGFYRGPDDDEND
ncbi:MAG TPA: NHL repeat-containing protein [Ktedonobacterales bacterium]|nr:NHL repeat-containing protein [Ktedonobacterales bacterium]